MAKEKTKAAVGRVALNVLVAPGTKAFIDAERGSRSQGVYVDEMVAVVQARGGEPVGVDTAAQAVAAVLARSELSASPWAQTRLKELGKEWSLDPKAMLDLVIEVFEGPKAALGQAEEAAARPANVSPGLHAPVPGDVACQCAHCPSSYTAARFGTLCPDCFRTGHRGDPKDCGECGLALGSSL